MKEKKKEEKQEEKQEEEKEGVDCWCAVNATQFKVNDGTTTI